MIAHDSARLLAVETPASEVIQSHIKDK